MLLLPVVVLFLELNHHITSKFPLFFQLIHFFFFQKDLIDFD